MATFSISLSESLGVNEPALFKPRYRTFTPEHYGLIGRTGAVSSQTVSPVRITSRSFYRPQEQPVPDAHPEAADDQVTESGV